VISPGDIPMQPNHSTGGTGFFDMQSGKAFKTCGEFIRTLMQSL
jgi:hypothetical protein